jgi:predicted nucleic acid-binding Zn ribbon protein
MAGETEPGDSLNECPICGSDIEENADYCSECGNDFSSENRYVY